jgi:CRISPR-associated protein (TIGR02710 family)
MSEPKGDKRSRFHRILSGDEIYDGDGTPIEQARRYRFEQLVPEALRRIAQRVAAERPEPVDLLVSLSGFSPETTIFAAAFLQPKALLVLQSHSARDGIDHITGHICMPSSQIDVQRVDPLDPVDLYERIRKAVEDYKRFNAVAHPKVIIDITGGKKSMSAGAALAAAQLDSRMCYIDGDFNPDIRQPEPGTERLEMLDNPTKLFGDRELESAELELRHGTFGAAYRRFKSVAETSPTPARARFGCDLASLYQDWSDLDFERLGDSAAAMSARLRDGSFRTSPALEQRIRSQLDFLEELARDPDGEPLMLTFFLLGRHYQSHGRHDFAALLYYRMLESLFELRLRVHGVSCSKPGWDLVAADHDGFAARFEMLSEAVFKREFRGLPFKIGMIESALLLKVLDDPMLPLFGLDKVGALKHLRSMSEARNSSVLAHGKTTVSPALSENLGNYALQALRAYWRLEHGDQEVDRRIEELCFVDEI